MKPTIPKDHICTNQANTIQYWAGTDSESEFRKNMQIPERRAQLEKYGFDRPDAITYQYNSHAFRCAEFDSTPGIITIGCSFTFGIGLPEHVIWPRLVANALGLSLWNLGVPSGSMDTCFRILWHWIDRLNAKCVLLLTPPVQRFELHTPKKTLFFIPQQIYHPIQKYWYDVSSNGELNFEKNLLAISALCAQHNKKLIVKRHPDDLFDWPRPGWQTARDLLHVGHRGHERLAEKFLAEIYTS